MVVRAVTNNVDRDGVHFEHRCGAAMYESEYRTQRTIRESISVADGLVKRALVKGQERGSATIARLVTFISVINRKGER